MSWETMLTRRVLVLFILLLAGAAAAEGWPRYRRDAARTGTATGSVRLPLQLQWTFEPDRPPQPAWPDPRKEPHRQPFDYAPVPVVSNGLVLLGSTTDDSVRALDAETGRVRWRFTTGGPVRFAPDVYEGRAYVASDDGRLYCLEVRTGELLWEFRAAPGDEMVLGNERIISRWPLRSGVLVDEGVVYVTAGMWPTEGVIVYALDAESGAELWRNDTTVNYMAQPHASAYAMTGVAPQGYLAADGDVLLVTAGRAVPAAFDRNDGRFLHYRQSRHQRLGGAWVTMDAERDVFINMTVSGDHAYRLSTGDLLDSRAYRMEEFRYVPEGWARVGEVAFRGGAGRITAHRAEEVRGERGVGGHYESTEHPAVYRRAVRRAGTAEEDLPATLWSARVEGYVRRLAVADGRLYASTDDGRIHCFAPAGAGRAEAAVLVRPAEPDPAPEPGPLARQALERLERRRVSRGYVLVLGEPEPDLPRALAAATEMHVLQVMGDKETARQARERLLEQTHLYGSRIAVTALPDSGELPLPPYFANLVVGGPETLEVSAGELYRALRPAGGLWLTGRPEGDETRAALQAVKAPSTSLEDSELGLLVRREKLPGAFDWDSAEPCDERLRWPLALAWFGGPGPGRMADRTSWGPTPVAAGGRYFHVGSHHVIAVDAYNGTELWSRSVPYAVGTLWKFGRWYFGCARRVDEFRAILRERIVLESLSADDESVYLNFGSVCYRLCAQTGRQQGVYGEFHEPEKHTLDGPRRFEFDVNATRSGVVTLTPEEEGLRIGLETRDPGVTNLDSWELFFDFRPPHRRADIYDPDDLDMFRVYVQPQTGRPRPYTLAYDRVTWEPDDPSARPSIEFQGGEVEGGTAVELFLPWEEVPAARGGVPAEFAFDATLVSYLFREGDIRTHVFGGDNTSGTFNNGWPVFVLQEDGAPQRERARVGKLADLPEHALRWGRRPARPADDTRYAGQRHRALTGETRTIQGTGSALNREVYARSYGCGPVVTSAQMDFFRSATLGYYDMEDDSGVRNFGGMRPGCGTALVPALGLLISSEASSGCTCSYNFQTSLALAPARRPRNEDWATYYERVGFSTSVNRSSVNLGAPGDRRHDDGYLWFGYPRSTAVRHRRGLAVPMTVEWDERLGPFRVNTDHVSIGGTDRPWVYGSAIRGIRRLGIDLGFYDPEVSVVSLPAVAPPAVDGAPDEETWDGARRVKLPERASTLLRHDDEHLYVAYERHAYVDRRGHRTPWRVAEEPEHARVRDEDHMELRLGARRADRGDLVRFAVSASGARNESHWSPHADTPRLDGLALDGQAGDWGEDGFRAHVAPGIESRLAWDERGLWLLLSFGEDAERPVRSVAFIAGRPGQEAVDNHLRLEVDLQERTWQAVLRRGGEESPGGVRVAESRNERRHVVEALFPWEELHIEPALGAEIGFPIWYHRADEDPVSPEQVQQQRRSFLSDNRQWRTVSRLRLAERAADPTEIVFPEEVRRPRAAYFAFDEDATWQGDWSAQVRLTDELFTAELAIPWCEMERLGLQRDDLLVDFGQAPPTDGTWQRRLDFDNAARTLHLDDTEAEPRLYTVRLHFAELDERVEAGDRLFDVALQGNTVLEGLDVVATAGGHRRALVRELRDVPAGRALEITFTPRSRNPGEIGAPILSGFEIEENPPGDNPRAGP